MAVAISRQDADRTITKLLNAPIAPGYYSRFINTGTEDILDALERNYFRGVLADGITCFKYLEGAYGSGKTQFILSLAARAHENEVVTSVVSIGAECPFNSQSAIFKSVAESFLPPDDDSGRMESGKGLEILIYNWIERQLRAMGIAPGQAVPEAVKRQIERSFPALWIGAPDQQMAAALSLLGHRLLAQACGAAPSVTDRDLINWVRGESVRSKALKEVGLHEPVRDENAFRRLKTVFAYLRTHLGYRGFLIAFDEGTRTGSSFRRGSAKQRQAIDNMLTMINDESFQGVMWLYAATPDFRSETIAKTYMALNDRIGQVSFSAGSPMVPLIDIETQNTLAMTHQIGEKLLDIFAVGRGVEWDREMQLANMTTLIEAQRDVLILFDKVPPRVFVFQYCRFLSQQAKRQFLVSNSKARSFVEANDLPDPEEDEE